MATLKRDHLYADVWTRPATTIAAELGLPRNTLKRICAGMDIPTPNTGYWISARRGRKRAKPDLPPPTPTTRLEWDVDLERSHLRRFLKRSLPEGGETTPPTPVPETTAPEKRHPLVSRPRWSTFGTPRIGSQAAQPQSSEVFAVRPSHTVSL